MESYYWLILVAILVVIELMTMGLTTVWFAVGGVAAYIAAVCGANIYIQVVIFLVVSLVTLLFTRPFAVKYINKDRAKTNVDTMPGKKAKVIEQIDNFNAKGRVQVDGQEWMARSADGEILNEGDEVVIKQVSGVKLIVEKPDAE